MSKYKWSMIIYSLKLYIFYEDAKKSFPMAYMLIFFRCLFLCYLSAQMLLDIYIIFELPIINLMMQQKLLLVIAIILMIIAPATCFDIQLTSNTVVGNILYSPVTMVSMVLVMLVLTLMAWAYPLNSGMINLYHL